MQNSEVKDLLRFAIEALYCCTFVLVFLTIIFLISGNSDAYGAAIVKKDAWLASAPAPRLIMVGGSGLAFGTDSKLIEEKTGYHPVNLGLYGTAGMDFMLTQVSKNSKAGDTIFLVPDYETLEADPYGGGFILLEMLQSDLSTIRYMTDFHSWIHIIRDFPGWIETRVYSFFARYVVALAFERESTLYRRVYTASNFNMYGDMIGHLTEPTHLNTSDMENGADGAFTGIVDPRTLVVLSQFMTEEEAKGVKVYLTWQAVPQTIFMHNKEKLNQEADDIGSAFGNSHVLGAPEDYVYPDTDFFDTPGHLAKDGRANRTAQFIHFIQTGIGQPN